MDSTLAAIYHHIARLKPEESLPPANFNWNTNLQLDEFCLGQLFLALEEDFGVRLSPKTIPQTVGEIGELLRKALAEKEKKLRRIITVPNLLSLFRLILIPVYAVLYLNAQSPKQYLTAGIILAVSCVTDLVDGYIARHFDQISHLGKVLDPVADKATQGIMLLCIAKERPILWWLIGLFIIKEGFQLVMGCWYLKKGMMLPGALLPGKISTTVLFVSMILLVIFPAMPERLAFLLILFCAFSMAVSLAAYIPAYFGKNKKVKELHP